MHLEVTDDQELFRDTTRRFIEAEMPMTTVRQLHETVAGYPSDWWVEAAGLGWTSLLATEEAGGGSLSGRPVADAAIVAEEIGRQCAPGPFLPTNIVIAALSAPDAGDVHGPVLSSLIDGTQVASWALAEPGDRWDPASFSTTARIDGESIIIDGTKSYVEAAQSADHFLVTVGGQEGLSQVLVAADAAGVSVVGAESIDLGRRFGTVRFDSARIPGAACVGSWGQAADQVEDQLQLALVLQSADTVGCLDRAFDFTLDYMNDRYAFGRPISSYQALKHRVADHLLCLESAKATTDAAIAAIDAAAADAGVLARVANTYVSAEGPRMVQDFVQFHGGVGVTWEHDLHLYLRRVTLNHALYGTPDSHREQLCKLLGV